MGRFLFCFLFGIGKRRSSVKKIASHDIGYDLYLPSAGHKKTVVMVYGWDLAGEDDPRVRRFSRSLAAAGLQVIVPVLEGMKTLSFSLRDVEILIGLIEQFHEQEKKKIAVTAFSFGAGIALTAACRDRIADKVDPLLLFSPPYSFSRVLEENFRPELPKNREKSDWDNYIWLRLVSEYRGRASSNLSDEDKEELRDLLFRYCAEATLKEKKDFYFRVLHQRPLSARSLVDEAGILEALSPEGKLKNLRSRLLVFVDPEDTLVSPVHAEKIAEEFGRNGERARFRLIITAWLSHVRLRLVFKFFEFFRLADMFRDLFRDPA